MCSARDAAALPTPGFPIRTSTGQRLFSASPWLIAAVHVLHRLLVPRHPPCALHILTVNLGIEILVYLATVQFSRSGERRGTGASARLCRRTESPASRAKSPPSPNETGARSLKTKQHAGRRGGISAGPSAPSRFGRRFGKDPRRSPRAPALTRWPLVDRVSRLSETRPFRNQPVLVGLPRKEVIQPHLPVRLPCYDFTPIAGPTFDGSLPCGLGHRLRVLPTFVV
jgi:hypothetical protein